MFQLANEEGKNLMFQNGTSSSRHGGRRHNPYALKRAYAWSYLDGKPDERTRFVAVLEIPPVDSPQTAVKMAIYSDIKQGEIRPSPS
jgi:hypothetical protein